MPVPFYEIVNTIGTVVGAVASLFGIFFGPDSGDEDALNRISEALGNIIRQNNQMIALLTYVTALLTAGITETAIAQNLESIQASVVYYNTLSSHGGRFHNLSVSDPYAKRFRDSLLDPHGVMYDLDAVYENIMGLNLDLADPLITGFIELIKKDPTFHPDSSHNDFIGMFNTTSLFMTRNLNFQIACYTLILWANDFKQNTTVATTTGNSIRPYLHDSQGIYQLMGERIFEETISFINSLGGYYSCYAWNSQLVGLGENNGQFYAPINYNYPPTYQSWTAPPLVTFSSQRSKYKGWDMFIIGQIYGTATWNLYSVSDNWNEYNADSLKYFTVATSIPIPGNYPVKFIHTIQDDTRGDGYVFYFATNYWAVLTQYTGGRNENEGFRYFQPRPVVNPNLGPYYWENNFDSTVADVKGIMIGNIMYLAVLGSDLRIFKRDYTTAIPPPTYVTTTTIHNQAAPFTTSPSSKLQITNAGGIPILSVIDVNSKKVAVYRLDVSVSSSSVLKIYDVTAAMGTVGATMSTTGPSVPWPAFVPDLVFYSGGSLYLTGSDNSQNTATVPLGTPDRTTTANVGPDATFKTVARFFPGQAITAQPVRYYTFNNVGYMASYVSLTASEKKVWATCAFRPTQEEWDCSANYNPVATPGFKDESGQPRPPANFTVGSWHFGPQGDLPVLISFTTAENKGYGFYLGNPLLLATTLNAVSL